MAALIEFGPHPGHRRTRIAPGTYSELDLFDPDNVVPKKNEAVPKPKSKNLFVPVEQGKKQP